MSHILQYCCVYQGAFNYNIFQLQRPHEAVVGLFYSITYTLIPDVQIFKINTQYLHSDLQTIQIWLSVKRFPYPGNFFNFQNYGFAQNPSWVMTFGKVSQFTFTHMLQCRGGLFAVPKCSHSLEEKPVEMKYIKQR